MEKSSSDLRQTKETQWLWLCINQVSWRNCWEKRQSVGETAGKSLKSRKPRSRSIELCCITSIAISFSNKRMVDSLFPSGGKDSIPGGSKTRKAWIRLQSPFAETISINKNVLKVAALQASLQRSWFLTKTSVYTLKMYLPCTITRKVDQVQTSTMEPTTNNSEMAKKKPAYRNGAVPKTLAKQVAQTWQGDLAWQVTLMISQACYFCIQLDKAISLPVRRANSWSTTGSSASFSTLPLRLFFPPDSARSSLPGVSGWIWLRCSVMRYSICCSNQSSKQPNKDSVNCVQVKLCASWPLPQVYTIYRIRSFIRQLLRNH